MGCPSAASGEMERVVAQFGCDHGFYGDVPLRIRSVQVVGGAHVLVYAAMQCSHIYISPAVTGAWMACDQFACVLIRAAVPL